MDEDRTDEQVSALRAVAHPVRLRILSLLTGTELSASEVARELGITQANASYHLRVLATAGEVVEAGEEKIRGGVAKRYRHPWDRAEQSKPSPQDRELYVRAIAGELVRRSRHLKPKSSTFTADAEMWVTPEVRDEVFDLVQQAARLVHAEAQPPRTQGTVHVNLTAAVFEMSDTPDTPENTENADPSVTDAKPPRVAKQVTDR